MQIISLRERPDAIALIAQWHFKEWQALFPGRTEADFASELALCLGEAALPQSWLLLDDAGDVAGTCSLLVHDMTILPQLTPWLANIYVRADLRGQGLGQRLVRHVMAEATGLGIATLYLFTEDQQAFYQRLGWQLWAQRQYENQQVSIMCFPDVDPLFSPAAED